MQSTPQATDPFPWRFKPGQSGNRFGSLSRTKQRALIAARVAEYADEWGGVSKLTAVELALLRRAAELDIGPRGKTTEERTRIANSVARLLRQVDRRRKREQPSELAGLLDDRHG
jgi:hypothetical protein